MKTLLLVMFVSISSLFAVERPAKILDCKQAAIDEAINMESAVCGGDISLLKFISAEELGQSKYKHPLAKFTFVINRESTDAIQNTITMEGYEGNSKNDIFCARTATESKIFN